MNQIEGNSLQIIGPQHIPVRIWLKGQQRRRIHNSAVDEEGRQPAIDTQSRSAAQKQTLAGWYPENASLFIRIHPARWSTRRLHRAPGHKYTPTQ